MECCKNPCSPNLVSGVFFEDLVKSRIFRFYPSLKGFDTMIGSYLLGKQEVQLTIHETSVVVHTQTEEKFQCICKFRKHTISHVCLSTVFRKLVSKTNKEEKSALLCNHIFLTELGKVNRTNFVIPIFSNFCVLAFNVQFSYWGWNCN